MKRFVVILIPLFFAACTLIDDDLSVCGEEYNLNYEMRLVTEIHLTIDEKLSAETDKPLADALKKWCDPIFSGYANDLEMDFYSLDGRDELRHHFSETVNGKQKTFTLTIPLEDYQHLAVVNVAGNNSMTLSGTQHAATMHLEEVGSDTIESHATSVYSARLPLMLQNIKQDTKFNVHLYMVSCAVALAVSDSSKNTHPVLSKMLVTGTANGFNVNDSTYIYNNRTRVVRAEKVMDRCYAALLLPSRDSLEKAAAPDRAESMKADDSLWQIKAYTQLPDGKVTETVLSIKHPLKASTLEIIKVSLKDDGSLVPEQESEVSVSVTLDWKEGNQFDIDT